MVFSMNMRYAAKEEGPFLDCPRCGTRTEEIAKSKFGPVRQCLSTGCEGSFAIVEGVNGQPTRFVNDKLRLSRLPGSVAVSYLEDAYPAWIERRRKEYEDAETAATAKAEREAKEAAEPKNRCCPESGCPKYREQVTNAAHHFCKICKTQLEVVFARALYTCSAYGCTMMHVVAEPDARGCVACGGELYPCLPEDLPGYKKPAAKSAAKAK